MREHPTLLTPAFKSQFADLLEGFLAEKRASGYKYNYAIRTLHDIDRALLCEALTPSEIPRELAERWLVRRPGEQPKSHAKRVVVMRQFSKFLVRNGIPAYIPHDGYAPRKPSSFVPRIFTFAEIRDLLDVIDRMGRVPTSRSPLRHLIMPEIFRVLYGCGLRVGEALRLRAKDVDLDEGILNICNTKFGKDRLVPMSPSLVQRLRRYRERTGRRGDNAYFFPARDRGQYHPQTVYYFFRQVLPKIGIVHGGPGYGPRVHDLRHTYAVHRLIRWYREGTVLSAKIPVLATYLGHRHAASTQKYLHLVPELFPEVTKSLETSVGHVIPGRKHHETD